MDYFPLIFGMTGTIAAGEYDEPEVQLGSVECSVESEQTQQSAIEEEEQTSQSELFLFEQDNSSFISKRTPPPEPEAPSSIGIRANQWGFVELPYKFVCHISYKISYQF